MHGARIDQDLITGYLERIGVARPPRPDAAWLRELHRAHLYAVPFENLSIHLGEAVTLEPRALVEKVVTARRGGFCYELNGAFAALLTALGYRVTLLAGRVFGAAGFGPPFDHLALWVETAAEADTAVATESSGEPGRPGGSVGPHGSGGPGDSGGPGGSGGSGGWLVDVGFGRHSVFPLRMDERGEQPDPGGTFRVVRTVAGDLDVLRDGEPQYRLETRARRLADFMPTCWWQCTSPDSHFTRTLVCSLLTEAGRITLSDHTLVASDAAGRHEALLTDREALAAYRDRFGIVLPRLPASPGASGGAGAS